MLEPVLTARDVSVELGGLPVLRGIDLTLRPGEAVALLGGNGSGKSTLVRALLGLVPTQRGSIELFGTPVGSFQTWSTIGYVPQRSTGGLAGAKVREVVASGRLAQRNLFRPPSSADRRAVTDALSAVGLLERANDELDHLSGGQQQRVLMARALANTPRLLLLDEPTAGVDSLHQRVLADVLTALVASGTTVLVVLHEIGALSGLLDRAVVLRDGRVVHDGVLDQVVGQHRSDSSRWDIHHGHEVDQPQPPARLLHGTVER
jgi:zinc transport system ATP-binding protein